jgi:O-antigen/teichoic acid export membrane protein
MISRIGRGVTSIAILNAFQFLVGILFYNIVSKILTPTEIGIMSTLNFVYTTFTVFAPLALHFGAVKYVAEYLGNNQAGRAAAVTKATIRLILISSTVFLAVYVAIAKIIPNVLPDIKDSELLFIIASTAAFVAVFRNTYLAYIQGLQLFDKYAIITLTTLSMSKFLGIILIMRLGLYGVLLGMLFGEFGGFLITLGFYKGHLPPAEGSIKSKDLLKFSLPIFGMAVIGTFQDWCGRMLFLITCRDLDALGILDLVIRAANSLGIIGAVIDVVMLPVLSEAYGRDGKKSIPEILTTALRYTGFMYFPASFGLATISRTAMTILYQQNLAEVGSIPLTILAVFTIFGTLSTIFNSALKSMGKTSPFIRISLLSLLVDAMLVTVLSQFIGIYGAVFARSASFLTSFLSTLFFLRKEVAVRFDRDGLWKGLAAAISIVPPVLIIDYSFKSSNIFIKLALDIALATVCYFASLLLLKAARKEDFVILRQIAPKHLGSIVTLLEKAYIR